MFLAALLPAVLLWGYVVWKDTKTEPLPQLAKAALYGILIAIPVVIVEDIVGNMLFVNGEPEGPLQTTIDAFLVAAIPEESFKLFALWLVVRRNKYFDEHFDGIVYAVSVGLGFAALENVFYLFESAEDWVSVAFLRGFLSVPGHFAFAVLMGYFYSLYHFGQQKTKWDAARILIIPVVAHGIFNALALDYLGILSIVILLVFCYFLHRNCKRKIMAQLSRDEDVHKA